MRIPSCDYAGVLDHHSGVYLFPGPRRTPKKPQTRARNVRGQVTGKTPKV